MDMGERLKSPSSGTSAGQAMSGPGLSGNQQSLNELTEMERQEIYDLRRKLALKEAMESDMADEVSLLTVTVDKLNAAAAQDKKRLSAMQLKMKLLQGELDEIKSRSPIPIKQVRPVTPEVTPSQAEPSVSRQELTDMKDQVGRLKESLNNALLRANTYEGANNTLAENYALAQLQVTSLSAELADSKKAYADMSDVLENYKHQLTEANEELALAKERPANLDSRGNSLFGELDENRKLVTERFMELKSKYVALLAKCQRTTIGPSVQAAEKANLLRLVEDIKNTSDRVATAELDSLRQRIRIQDDLIKKLMKSSTLQSTHPQVPCTAGAIDMKYVEKLLKDAKTNEVMLLKKVNGLSKEKVMLQQKIITMKKHVLTVNKKLAKTTACSYARKIDLEIPETPCAEMKHIRSITEPVLEDMPGPSTVGLLGLAALDGQEIKTDFPSILHVSNQRFQQGIMQCFSDLGPKVIVEKLPEYAIEYSSDNTSLSPTSSEYLPITPQPKKHDKIPECSIDTGSARKRGQSKSKTAAPKGKKVTFKEATVLEACHLNVLGRADGLGARPEPHVSANFGKLHVPKAKRQKKENPQ